MASNVNNDDDGFFNDLSRQPHSGSRSSGSPQEQGANGEEGAPRTKRIACVICRKRKLKCDGKRPKCATCDRLGHNCAYDEVRRKSGPKRGYVKDLEARLAQVETQLESKAKKSKSREQTIQEEPQQNDFANTQYQDNTQIPGMQMPEGSYDSMQTTTDPLMLPITSMAPGMMPDPEMMPNMGLNLDDSFSWEMISLGLEEPMPMQEAIDELTQVYFDIIHPSLPMLHKHRYLASMDFACERRPPICLRYIMWCHAAAVTDRYIHHQDIFYRRARKYIELDEMKGQGEAFVSVAHAQVWVLIATYEFKMMYFPRAWMSVGRAARLVLMMGLNRVDGVGLDVKQCLPPPKDWTEREERRRTFWMAYNTDRYASIGTGWPMTIDERDIMTVLPASEEAYDKGLAQQTQTLNEGMTPQQVKSLSPFAGVVFVTHFFGLNLTHLHRPEPGQEEDNMAGKFWTRHRNLDNSLSQTSMLLPDHLRLPAGLRNPNTVFLNFSIHTSTICLHQAAIFKAEKNQLPNRVMQESRDRCVAAASRIAEIMRLSSDMDVAAMNPFLAFCLYVAARVFIQFLKKMPNNTEIRASLDLLLTAMRVLQRKNPLTESFLVQLNLDIEGSDPDYFTITTDRTNSAFLHNSNPNISHKTPTCSPVIHISENPEESRSPEETRFPKWDCPNEQSTARLDSPRQTQFAFRSTNSDDVQKARNMFPHTGSQPTPLPGIFPGDNWNESFGTSGPFGPSPVIPKNNFDNGGFDIEMSDQSGANNSTGLTPGSSASYNHSSSNTSYTPPEMHAEESTNSRTATMPPISGVYNSYTAFSPPTGNMFAAQPSDSGSGRSSNNMNIDSNGNLNGNIQGNRNSNLQENDPFKLAAGWDQQLGNVNSPVSLTGMTPEGGWANWEG